MWTVETPPPISLLPFVTYAAALSQIRAQSAVPRRKSKVVPKSAGALLDEELASGFVQGDSVSVCGPP